MPCIPEVAPGHLFVYLFQKRSAPDLGGVPSLATPVSTLHLYTLGKQPNVLGAFQKLSLDCTYRLRSLPNTTRPSIRFPIVESGGEGREELNTTTGILHLLCSFGVQGDRYGVIELLHLLNSFLHVLRTGEEVLGNFFTNLRRQRGLVLQRSHIPYR